MMSGLPIWSYTDGPPMVNGSSIYILDGNPGKYTLISRLQMGRKIYLVRNEYQDNLIRWLEMTLCGPSINIDNLPRMEKEE